MSRPGKAHITINGDVTLCGCSSVAALVTTQQQTCLKCCEVVVRLVDLLQACLAGEASADGAARTLLKRLGVDEK